MCKITHLSWSLRRIGWSSMYWMLSFPWAPKLEEDLWLLIISHILRAEEILLWSILELSLERSCHLLACIWMLSPLILMNGFACLSWCFCLNWIGFISSDLGTMMVLLLSICLINEFLLHLSFVGLIWINLKLKLK